LATSVQLPPLPLYKLLRQFILRNSIVHPLPS
jgi:hypothetical protein